MQTRLERPLPGRRIHFVGIGGAGMAALAELALAIGYEVSGSDLKESRAVRRLLELGARVEVGSHQAAHADGADHVIVSAAVPNGNPEVERARQTGAEVLSRAELLGRVFDAGRGVAVSGTHGKTTTASMLARVLDVAGFAPSFVIGGDLNDVGSGARLGPSDLVVAEADEAYGSFLHLRADVAVVTNVDVDHLDHYPDQRAIDEAFLTFLGRREGTAVLCVDDAGVGRIIGRVDGPVVTYGFGAADLQIAPAGDGAWSLRWQGRDIGPLRLGVPGRHNVLNAAGAAGAALVLGADAEAVVEGLRTFTGVERRFSVRGEAGGVTVVDDYAHNPAKVAATLAAARDAYPGRRVIALFQPHLYSRTSQLAEAFGASFDHADVVVVTNVYGAREDPLPGVTGRLVLEAIHRRAAQHLLAVYIPRLEEAAGFVVGLAEPGDVVLTMGAGDVTTAAPYVLELLRQGEAPGP